jgi:soluble lytic murein transglycosylase-like protein
VRWIHPFSRYKLAALGLLSIAVCGTALAASANDAAGNPDAKKSGAKIYKYLQGGTPSFSDVPPSKVAYVVYRPTCYACAVTSSIDWWTTPLHRVAFGDEIALAARQYALDPALVRAVIHAESNFNASARSHKGAMGLMQLMPGTARMLGVTEPHTPGHNILGGAQYLAGLLVRFKNDVALATAAYNAGPEAVQRYAGVPPYAETQVYVQRVKILHQRYREITTAQR